MKKFKVVLSTIYFRFAAVMLALLLSLIGILFWMWRWGTNAIREELVGSAASHVQYLCSYFQDSVNSVMMQLSYLSENRIVNRFLIVSGQEDPVDYYTSVTSLMNVLRIVSGSNRHIEDLKIYYIPLDLMVSSIAVEPGGSRYAEGLAKRVEDYSSSLITSDGNYMVALSMPNLYRQGDQVYMIAATLSTKGLQDHLGDYDSYSGKRAFMVYHNTGEMLFSEAMTAEEKEMVQKAALPKLRTDTGEVYSLEIQSPSGGHYMAVACYSRSLRSSFVQLIPMDKLEAIPRLLQTFLLIFSVLAILFVIAFVVQFHYQIRKPMIDLQNGFGKIERGDLGTTLVPAYSYEYNGLINSFNHMSLRLAQMVKENYEQTICIQEAELRQLQSQIAPHFLYNSFMFISNMLAEGEVRQAKRFLHHLSKYYEYLTRNEGNIIELKEEYVHSINYMSIQEMRFDGLFEVQIELLAEEFWQIPVPRLILQPLLENAVEHGVPPESEGVTIRMTTGMPENEEQKEEYLCIRVENGGWITDGEIAEMEERLLAPASGTSSVSLYNINTRLKLFYRDKACGLTLRRSELGGLCVEVTIRRNTKEGQA